jgi:hypothetical protein
MKIPEPELRKAETKCNILSHIEEDFRHVITDLERRYQTQIRIDVIRPIFGGGAGLKQIVLQELENAGSEASMANNVKRRFE